MRLLPLLAAGLVAFAATPAAAGHGTPSQAGYVSTVSGVEPAVPGLLVSVLGGDDLLSVRNWSGKTVVLTDPEGKPFLRFEVAPGGDAGLPTWALVLVGAAGAFVLAAALALPLVRREGEDGKREAATER